MKRFLPLLTAFVLCLGLFSLPSGFGSEKDLIYFNINNEKRIWERGTVYCNDPWDLPEEAMDIMYRAGSSIDPPDVESILYDYCPEP